MLTAVFAVSVIGPLVSMKKYSQKATAAACILEGLEVEAAPESTDVTNQGVTHSINYVNPDFTSMQFADSISLFTNGKRAFVSESSIKTNIAILVNASTFEVKKVYNKAPSADAKPSFTESTDITPGENEFVLLACDSSYLSAGYKKYLATNFDVGDVIKLKLNGEAVTVAHIINKINETPAQVEMKLDKDGMFTIFTDFVTISGTLSNTVSQNSYTVLVRKLDSDGNVIMENNSETEKISVDANGVFSKAVVLEEKTNYIDISFSENSVENTNSVQSIIVYNKSNFTNYGKEVVMWTDQFSNAKIMNTVENIEKVIAQAKKAGVTAIALDVKGPEGYVSYKKATLTNTPYLTETTNPNKKIETEIDILEETIKACHSHGIKLFAAFNFFTEGNIAMNDSAVLANHPEWEEILQTPEDKGELKTASTSLNKNCILKYVNPANPEVVQFQLDRAKEVLDNYDIDAIVMDRTRYDNIYADFSNISKLGFEAYLQSKNKQLVNWPDDAFKIDSTGKRTDGQFFNEWIEYRASVIKDFASKMEIVIETHNTLKSKKVELSAYVGAWYDVMYQNGLNWASENFTYNEKLNMPKSDLYTQAYNDVSYLKHLDFLMIGTYYGSAQEVAKYSTLVNILTESEIPVYSSLDLTSCKTPQSQREVMQACLNYSDGCMIFDMVYSNWLMIECAIKDVEYVNPFYYSATNPVDSDVIVISNRNVARNEDNIILYDSTYGETTGTNQFGVEVVVDASGIVTAVKNKLQATNWSWGSPELNNSLIPAGGFVLSATDRSGSRVLRQLLATKFAVGDKVCAAMLGDYSDYTTNKYSTEKLNFTSSIKVYGTQSFEVYYNNVLASKDTSDISKYTANINIANGNNEVVVKIMSDGKLILQKTINVIGEGIVSTPLPEPINEIKKGCSQAATDSSGFIIIIIILLSYTVLFRKK
jgi:uncharacterized lipoprotein YddW (UPF0748 family)